MVERQLPKLNVVGSSPITRLVSEALEANQLKGFELLPEDPDAYKAENVFFVPVQARWPALQAQARQPNLRQIVDMAIERENLKLLKEILPKVCG